MTDTVPALRASRIASSSALRVADGLDGDVDAAALGQRLDRAARVLLGEVHRARRRSVSAISQALARRCRSRSPARRRRRARPARRTGRPGRGRARRRCRPAACPPRDGVVAGAHDVAGEQRDVVAHPLGHPAQRQVGVGDEHLLGLRALEFAERLAVAEDRGRGRTCGSRRAGRRSTCRRRRRSSRARGRRRRRSVTPSPAATTAPTYSWPIVKPGSISTRPW